MRHIGLKKKILFSLLFLSGLVWALDTVHVVNPVSLKGSTADNSSNAATKVPVLPARANSGAPAWTEGNQVPLSVDLNGALRVNGASGGGIAQTQVRNAAGTLWLDVSTGTASATLVHMPVSIQGTGADSIEPLNVAPGGSEFSLPVRNIPSGTQAVSGTVNVSTSNVKISDGVDVADVTAASALKVDGSGVTQPVSGTVTANQGTNPWIVYTSSSSVIPDRPSQKSGRARFEATADDLTASTTIYVVTGGKTAYVESMMVSGYNSSTTTAGRLKIQDAGNLKIPFSMPPAGLGTMLPTATLTMYSATFPEPIPFATNINLNEAAGTLNFSLHFIGYEE